MTSLTKVDNHTPATIDPTAIREMWAGRVSNQHISALSSLGRAALWEHA